jgi:hypothetical protein
MIDVSPSKDTVKKALKEIRRDANGDRNWLSDLDLNDMLGNLANFAGAAAPHVSPEKVQAYTYTPTFGPTYYNINPVL